MDASTTGAYHELQVSQRLMESGYCVFRNLSPTGPCDLVAIKGDEVVRIEVCAGHRTKEKKPYQRHDGRHSYDVLAHVWDGWEDCEIRFYNNDDSEWFLNLD